VKETIVNDITKQQNNSRCVACNSTVASVRQRHGKILKIYPKPDQIFHYTYHTIVELPKRIN